MKNCRLKAVKENMKKLLGAIFMLLLCIASCFFTVFADSGQSNVNVMFIVLTSVLAPILVGVIIYYAYAAKKQRNKNLDEQEKSIIVRENDDK